MKKILLTVASSALCLAASQNLQAQSIAVAPELGLNLSKVTGSDAPNSDMKLGFKGGVNVHIPLSDQLFLSPGLHYSVKGFQNEITIPIINQTITSKVNYGYLELPVNLMYRMPVGAGAFFFSAGPYLGYGIGGNYTVNENQTAKVEWGSGIGDNKPLDIGINAGLGYELPMGLYIRAQYGHGLTSLSNIDNIKINNQNIQFSLGYNLWTWAR